MTSSFGSCWPVYFHSSHKSLARHVACHIVDTNCRDEKHFYIFSAATTCRVGIPLRWVSQELFYHTYRLLFQLSHPVQCTTSPEPMQLSFVHWMVQIYCVHRTVRMLHFTFHLLQNENNHRLLETFTCTVCHTYSWHTFLAIFQEIQYQYSYFIHHYVAFASHTRI